MALKPDRQVDSFELGYFLAETATRGGIVSVSTAGSGVAMDNGNAVGTYKANPSGAFPIGLLLQDVVNKDLTQTPQNMLKDECQINTKPVIMTHGWVVTNMILSGQTPTAGAAAYVAHSGYISYTDVASDAVNAAATRKVGKFLSVKDENGFAKVAINLPL